MVTIKDPNNLDTSNLIIMRKEFSNMNRRVVAYINLKNKNPEKVYLISGKPQYITFAKYDGMHKRWLIWYNLKKDYPAYVSINRVIVAPVRVISEFHRKLEYALGGQYNNATQLYKLFITNIYSYYYNDRYDQAKELARLRVHTGLNCSDVSQIGRTALLDMGYNVHICRADFKCGGHVYLEVEGKEFDSWTWYDLAGAMKWDYPIDQLMCSGTPTNVNRDQGWLISDDGA